MPEEPGTELMVSSAALEELENEPFRVTTGPLEVPDGQRAGADPGDAPDWVMVGLPNGAGGVTLFASRTLTRAAFRRQVTGFSRIPVTDKPNGPVARVLSETRTVVAEMKDFTVIHAESYPAALRTLMEMWDRA